MKTVCLVENDETNLQLEQLLSVNIVYTGVQSSSVPDDPTLESFVDPGSRHRRCESGDENDSHGTEVQYDQCPIHRHRYV